MKKSIIILKIIGTAIIVFAAFVFYILAIAVSASSHNISAQSREHAIRNGNIALIICPIFLICIWLPWKKWFYSPDNETKNE